MAVAVFGQLDHLLRERNLTVEDLERQIEEQYGLDVDVAALDRLAGPRLCTTPTSKSSARQPASWKSHSTISFSSSRSQPT